MDNKNDDFNTLFSNLYESKKNASNLEKIENIDINKKSDSKTDDENAKKSNENQDKKKNIIYNVFFIVENSVDNLWISPPLFHNPIP